ncbi:MAG: hypothetical protein VYC39_17175 [Myxococcota bacterium]|nr:hypothetical protein [Myxococcota bacterium]
MKITSTITMAICLGTSIFAPTASANEEARISSAKAKLDAEPKVDAVVRKALAYFRVQPSVMDSLRTKARVRGILPNLAVGYRFDRDDYTAASTQSPTPLDQTETNKTYMNAMTVGAVWDLRQLIFNPAEIQVYGLIGVQRDLMLEVTRIYFLRRQLYLRKILRPPEDPIAREALQLRIDEFTSLLDVLTGGWFSESTAKAIGSR